MSTTSEIILGVNCLTEGCVWQRKLVCLAEGQGTPAGQPEGLPEPVYLLHTEHTASSAQRSQPLQGLPPAHIPAAAEELSPPSQH